MKYGRVRDENKDRAAYRGLCPRHVVKFELDGNENAKRAVSRLADRARMAGNQAVAVIRNRISQMKRTKEYRTLLKEYARCSERMIMFSEDTREYIEAAAERKAAAGKMSAMQKRFGITFGDVRNIMKKTAVDYGIHSVFALTRAEDIWRGAEKVLFSDGENMHFRERGNLPALRAKQTSRAIVLKAANDDDGAPYLSVTVNGAGIFRIRRDDRDWFLTDEYRAILAFMLNPEQEDTAVSDMLRTGAVSPVFRPVCCSAVCRTIRGKLRCFLLVTVAADPVPKLDRFGNRRHAKGKGRVGMKVGTRSAAAVSDGEVLLENLGECSPGHLKKTERRKKYLLRKMNMSRHATNPGRFSPDGSYRRRSRGRWKYSRAYYRYRDEYREICRREAAARESANNALANRIRSLGNELVLEMRDTSRFAKRRRKETGQQDKTSAGAKSAGASAAAMAYKKQRRFWYSAGIRAPAAFRDVLKKAFGEGCHIISGDAFRAGQNELFLEEYTKKEPLGRWYVLPDGRRVHKDIISAFLLYCADDTFTETDCTRYLREFERFWENYNGCIARITKKGLRVNNSGTISA